MDYMTQVLSQLRFEPNYVEGIRLGFGLIAGGLLALYLKHLHAKYSSSIISSDSITKIFPVLTMVTICVIAVVKSSLALSLGLVGALSIVRFRAAIKDPEELVWLFLCIAVGLAIGAGHLIYAVVLVFIISIFVIWRYYFVSKRSFRNNLLITITGNSEKYFTDDEPSVFNTINNIAEIRSIQRYEIDREQGTIRFVLEKADIGETVNLLSEFRKKLPGCQISYINMDNSI